MDPLRVTTGLTLRRRRWLPWIAGQPLIHIVVVELLGPQQPGECLPLEQSIVVTERSRLNGRVVVVGLTLPLRKNSVEHSERIRLLDNAGQPQPKCDRVATP